MEINLFIVIKIIPSNSIFGWRMLNRRRWSDGGIVDQFIKPESKEFLHNSCEFSNYTKESNLFSSIGICLAGFVPIHIYLHFSYNIFLVIIILELEREKSAGDEAAETWDGWIVVIFLESIIERSEKSKIHSNTSNAFRLDQNAIEWGKKNERKRKLTLYLYGATPSALRIDVSNWLTIFSTVLLH